MRVLPAAVAALALLAGGCGQKGPLYLPDKKPAAVTPPAAAPQPAPPGSTPTKKPGDNGDAPPPQGS
jgi:predicted small lipoprotein YifL